MAHAVPFPAFHAIGACCGVGQPTQSRSDIKTGQWTGWNLKGLTGTPTFTGTGDIQWNDPTFGETTFTEYHFAAYDFGAYDFGAYNFGDYQFADYQFGPAGSFGAWDTDNTNAEPGVCENNGNIVPDSIKHTFTNGPVEESAVTSSTPAEGPVVESEVTENEVQNGEVHEDDVQYGAVQYGEPVPGSASSTGPAALFVNGIALPNTPTV